MSDRPDPANNLCDRTLRVPSPSLEAEIRPWCLVVLRGAAIGQRFELADAASLGRDPDSDIYLPEPSISRRQCHIFRKRGSYWVSDLGATNPTSINGIPVEASPLLEGDLLTVGDLVLKLLGPRSPENALVAALHDQAIKDDLTGLANRRHFHATMQRRFAATAKRERLSLIAIDLDHFKSINDRWGHAAGDRVLKAVGEALRGSLRTNELPARIGGEEFAVLLPNADASAALETGLRLHAALTQMQVHENGVPIPTTASLGLATAAESDPNAAALYARADAALYEAKRSGRNRVLAATS